MAGALQMLETGADFLLGPTERQIGVRRRERNYRRAAFVAGERDDGGITPDGINVDSGVLNPQLNAEEIGPHARRSGRKLACGIALTQ
jgi:hypothetical protein